MIRSVYITAGWLFLASFLVQAVPAQTLNTYRFDFGDGRAQPGFLPVSPASVYSDGIGYGFMPKASLSAGGRSGKNMRLSWLNALSPVYFSVKLPEGNYRIRIWLGGGETGSSTMIRTECRRLIEERVVTKPGQQLETSFIVHIRDSIIRSGDGSAVSKVRLKPRERDYLHWDNLLTLEFNDTAARVAGLTIERITNKPVLFLAGNSTVVDQDKEPWASWGQMIPAMLTDELIVANYAESGETLKAFRAERRLEKIWSMAKPGDYLAMEFGHNDQKPGGNRLDPYTTYTQTLREWIAECRNRNIIPILVTPVNRRRFDSSGNLLNTLEEYPNAVRKLAKDEKTLLIDLNAMSKTLFESLGVEGSKHAFVHFPANSFPDQPEKLEDNTHFSTYGAYLLARCIAADLAQRPNALREFIKKTYHLFDPSRPIPFSSFYLPFGQLQKAVKPDGN